MSTLPIVLYFLNPNDNELLNEALFVIFEWPCTNLNVEKVTISIEQKLYYDFSILM
jgi:hypothetical protein